LSAEVLEQVGAKGLPQVREDRWEQLEQVAVAVNDRVADLGAGPGCGSETIAS